MISKELLSEVLRTCQVADVQTEIEDENELKFCYYINDIGDVQTDYINIYELADECKIWALEKDSIISLDIYCSTNTMIEIIGRCDDGEDGCLKHTIVNKEYNEAIFKACQWIMEQKK